MGRLRVAVGGIQHETNSFAPKATTLDDFNLQGSSPPILRGAELLSRFPTGGAAIGGMVRALQSEEVEILPLLWAEAQPGGVVTAEAFAALTGDLLARLQALDPVDMVVLDLHGAMVAQGVPDAEGWLLAQLRQVIGPETFLAAALDFHGNLSALMVAESDLLLSYRTYPHVDMEATGARLVQQALLWHRQGKRPAKAFAQGEYLIPIHAQSTLRAPMTELATLQAAVEARHQALVNFLPGFPPADVADCGPSLLAYAEDQAGAEAALQAMMQALAEAEPGFAAIGLQPGKAAVALALQRASGPVILVDSQDNPGAGASSDTMGLVRALLNAGASDAVVAVVHDPQAAAFAHEAGLGAWLDLTLGGKGGSPGAGPLDCRVTVEALGDGRFAGTGGYYKGNPLNYGPMALLRIADSGVQVIVGSTRAQAGSRAIFHHLGLDPARIAVIGLKSSVHFMADFAELTDEIHYAAFPGLNLGDPAEFPYRHLRPGLRRRPSS